MLSKAVLSRPLCLRGMSVQNFEESNRGSRCCRSLSWIQIYRVKFIYKFSITIDVLIFVLINLTHVSTETTKGEFCNKFQHIDINRYILIRRHIVSEPPRRCGFKYMTVGINKSVSVIEREVASD